MSHSTKFRIRLVAGGSVSLALGVESMTIDIWDTTNDLLCIYELRGISLGKGTPVSVSLRGPWNDFTVQKPMSCDDFGGLATFGTVYAANKSVNRLRLSPVGRDSVDLRPFKTGWTLGAGFGAGVGVLGQVLPAISATKAPWPHDVSEATTR